MPVFTHIATIVVKELRELFHRPLLVLTLIVGPLALLILFGIGSDAGARPPRAIIVTPADQPEPPLLRDYQQQFRELLDVVGTTTDEAAAREQLRLTRVDTVLILPPAPFQTIASGQPATITVLYNEIDPLWRGLVPRFVRGLASEINRLIFLQNADEQRGTLGAAAEQLNTLVAVLDQAIAAVERRDWVRAREFVTEALVTVNTVERLLDVLGPEAEALRSSLERTRARLETANQLLEVVEQAAGPADGEQVDRQLGLVETRASLGRLRDAITAFTAVSPEVVLAPLAIDAQYTANIRPDFITFFAPAILALLLQHVAVSLGALAIVRERLNGTFDLYTIAPISIARLLAGKYIAYVLFTLAIALVLLLVLLFGMRVPLFGSVWWLLLTLILLVTASVGLGFTMSLLAVSERQAVQFSMFALLAIVFFSGFALPLDAIRQPALAISYLLPATYGVTLFQNVMLRGLPADPQLLLALFAISLALFAASWALLRWRTRAG